MKAKSFIFALFAVAVCFYGCESSSLDESKDDSSTTVPSEEKQDPDDENGKNDPNNGGDDYDEVVELPNLPDLEDVDDVCLKMTDINFMAYCYDNFDVNHDGKVSMIEANAVKTISCSTAEDFTGIEYFPNLESFESTSAKYLDLRYNAQLSDINFCVKVSSSTYESAPIEELDLRYCLNLTSIGERAFYYCSDLTKIDLPSGLTSIGDYSFRYCTGLTSIDFPDSLTSIGNYAFSGSGLTLIELPSGLTSIERSVFSDCSGLTKIDLPSGLTSIGDYSFNYCTGLTSIDFPASLTSIGERAFMHCKNLESVTSRAETPPSVYGSSKTNSTDTFYDCFFALYVPYRSEASYKYKYGWSNYSSEILPISE